MDDKASRRTKAKLSGWRSNRRISTRRELLSYLREKRSVLLTAVLLIAIVALLFGLASQIPGPGGNASPPGTIAVDYSSFLKQVESHNVMAVVIQGDDINALLKTPLNANSILKHQDSSQNVAGSSDYATWSHSIGLNNTATSNLLTSNANLDLRSIYTHVPTSGKMLLLATLNANNVMVNTLPVSPSSQWLTLIIRFLPLLLLAVLSLVFFFGRNQQNPLNALNERMGELGKSRARRFENSKEVVTKPAPKAPKLPGSSAKTTATSKTTARVTTIPQVTFADVAGINEVRAELEEMVQFLQTPERFDRLGARIPRGALLVGPPGTGKTLLAKAVAGEANVPFFSMSASEFVEMFVGVGASRVRDLFRQARQVAPCVIFIDEIDAVGRKRTMRAAGSDERDQTLNQLLVELDGFDSRQAVVVLAATNRVDILDPALLRPGRFDRRVMVSSPDRAGREAILRVHTRKTPLYEDVSLDRLARLTTGMTGADLANLVNEAALSAARRNLDCVHHECFEEALARIQLGALRPIVMNDTDRRIIAIHEGGHALVAHHLPEADTVNRVTILPRGQSLGVTQFTAEVDRYNYSRETLMTRIAVGLGGRVAEELTFGAERITTGAENDLQVVTDLARRMVTRWGMSEHVGLVFTDYQAESGYALNMRNLDPADMPVQARSLVADKDGNVYLNGRINPTPRYYASAGSSQHNSSGIMMNALIDAEVQRIINQGRDLARTILTEHGDQLTLLANELIEHEQLDRAQFEALLKQ